MKILHIANDYAGSTVYKNLVRELDCLGLSQVVYTPVKEKGSIGKNHIGLSVAESEIIYSPILNMKWDRIFYRRKINKIVRDIESKVNLREITFIHAHTWYSDGGVAYILAKKYNVPYIVTIRNTDLNLFQKYMIHLRPFGRKILERAKDVVLISASYKERLLKEESLKSITGRLRAKTTIIANGVDSFWIENAAGKKKNSKAQSFNYLYIGKFTADKNVLTLQKAIKEIFKENHNVCLHLIGGGGNMHQDVIHQAQLNPTFMKYHGKVSDMRALQNCFLMADAFVMPSKHETFGLVYVEALLQGLPILYTHNEGIDGFYEEKIGEKVLSGDHDEIKEKLLSLMVNYNTYDIPTDKLIVNHSWQNIAKRYKALYSN